MGLNQNPAYNLHHKKTPSGAMRHPEYWIHDWFHKLHIECCCERVGTDGTVLSIPYGVCALHPVVKRVDSTDIILALPWPRCADTSRWMLQATANQEADQTQPLTSRREQARGIRCELPHSAKIRAGHVPVRPHGADGAQPFAQQQQVSNQFPVNVDASTFSNCGLAIKTVIHKKSRSRAFLDQNWARQGQGK